MSADVDPGDGCIAVLCLGPALLLTLYFLVRIAWELIA